MSVPVINKSDSPCTFNQFCNYLYNKADRIGHHLVLFPFQTTDTQIVHGQLDKQLKKVCFISLLSTKIQSNNPYVTAVRRIKCVSTI